jgi:cathepsin L
MARSTEIILLTLISVAAIGLYSLESNKAPVESVKFEMWKETMNKNYDNQENSYRLGVWMNNWKYVQEHNQKYNNGEETYELEMNQFADLTSEEFGARYLGYNADLKTTSKCTGSQAPSQNLPDEVDWSAKGATTPIKNQGQCGSCWAFSTTGSIEGAHFLSSSKLSSFSEQQLVDCSTSYGNHGCQGGLMDFAFYYIKDHGLTLEATYPYRGVNGQCHYN